VSGPRPIARGLTGTELGQPPAPPVPSGPVEPADTRPEPADAQPKPADTRPEPADGPSAPANARPRPADARAGPADAPVWLRLHPMTPIVSAARSLVVVAAVEAENAAAEGRGASTVLIVLGALAFVNLVISAVRYLVTRWALDGPTLRIETGLFRRDARQLPLARVQAVDVVAPFFARIFGLAEVRVRLAGTSRANGRLAYLSASAAREMRARILAGHYGLDQATPEPRESLIATVGTGQLLAAALLSGATVAALAWFALGVVLLATLGPETGATAGFGTFAVLVIGLGRSTWRRVTAEYGFSIGLAPDGIRLRRGLLSTVSETVPLQRVQAVRKIEPLAWRLIGWCRLEVDVAGSPGKEGRTRSSQVTKALLPVGQTATSAWLLSSLLGLEAFPLTPPPARAFWKAPFSYHFLRSGTNATVVAATTGRLRKVTVWVPFAKTQSVRLVEGPLQRALGLATVCVDAAGRKAQVACRDREKAEAAALFQEVVAQSRASRRQDASSLAGGRVAPSAAT
jgi:putative membrane protein